MSQTPNGESDRDAFTCGRLLMCLYLPGLSRKKPEEAGKSRQPTTEQDQRTEQEPPQMPSHAASLEKLECSSLYSGSNIVFDFLVGEPEEGDDRAGALAAVQGYCPSPCFDLPVELIRADRRCSVVASDTPVTSAFVFDGYHGGTLKKMASCLASGGAGSEERPPHLVRFLSASGSSPPVMSSCSPPKGSAVDGDREFAGRARGVIQWGAADRQTVRGEAGNVKSGSTSHGSGG